MSESINRKSNAPYALGFLGIIPLVGFFVGLALLILGITKYRDKKLSIIGIVCMLFSVVAYSTLYYVGFKSDFGKNHGKHMLKFN